MATDATGTPTTLGIPKFNTAADPPSGKGFNATMDALDTLLAARITKATLSTTGDIMYASSANTPARLAVGSTGQVLTVAGGVPAWGTAAVAIPTGALMMWVTASAPSGWVLCDGTSYLRSGDPAGMDALFAVISTGYGFADGTHFNVPDIRGRIPVGLGTNASVNALNTNDGQVVGNRRPHHRTSLTDPQHTHITGTSRFGGAGVTITSIPGVNTASTDLSTTVSGLNSASTGITVGTGVANDALDTPSFIVVTYIIKK